MSSLGVGLGRVCYPCNTTYRKLASFTSSSHRLATRCQRTRVAPSNVAALACISRTSIGMLGCAGQGRISRRQVRVRAVAAPVQEDVVVAKEFALVGGATIKVTVYLAAGNQRIHISTTLTSSQLLLHWGVEGGKAYKGGWRLPEQAFRPPGTQQYKDRALQTPFKQSGGENAVEILLAGEEASDVLNFVLKDSATNTWYDLFGSNFAVPLRASASDDGVPVVAIPELPPDLCNVWAYIKWEHAGAPRRSDAESAAEFKAAIQEMQDLLRSGRPLEELSKVSRGEIKYDEYRRQYIDGRRSASVAKAVAAPQVAAPPKAAPAAPKAAPVAPKAAPTPKIPEEMISIKAYLLWESAGKPAGADFGQQARAALEEEVRRGKDIEQIRKELAAPAPAAPAKPASGTASAAAPPPAKAAPQAAQVGQSSGPRVRNPMDLIKKSAAPPMLSMDKDDKPIQPLAYLVQRAALDPTTFWRRVHPLGGKSELLVVVKQPQGADGPVNVSVITDNSADVVLHWAVTQPGSKEWKKAPESIWPDGTDVLETGNACETPFSSCDSDECEVEPVAPKVPLQNISFTLPAGQKYSGLTFVLRSGDGTMWWKDGNSNFFVPLPGAAAAPETAPTCELHDAISNTIIENELSAFHWTLMHRYNRAADLLEEIMSGKQRDLTVEDGLARIFVWLRYSSIRQLTWQRNYNTQPRILSSAQDRLTNAIASAHAQTTGEAQELARLMLTCVGRGGDGQRIRDEILNIMHRNHIPELKGTWMEEWHQKLHNNTTPDDVAICEAYIAFNETNGSLDAYWRVLSDNGITKQRLESFERPVVTMPAWYPDKKDSLLREFRNYLGILKNVHTGADLQASAAQLGGRLPQGARGYLGYVLSHLNDNQILPLLEAAVEARTELARDLAGNRDLLYLDLALEEQIRNAAERGAGGAGFGAAAFMQPLLQNLALTCGNNEEICFCLKAWQGLPPSIRNGSRPSREEALLAVAVVNRIRRALADLSDHMIQRIEPVSTAYGKALSCENWAVEVFAEEVVRGGPSFAVSIVISSIEPTLRAVAALGSWQVISPRDVVGVVEVVPNLHEIQDVVYSTPTVLVTEHVSGEEDIPEGVVAVLTADAPDVLSHVSVRARNMKVLFATCYETEPLKKISAEKGKWLAFKTTAAGAVTWAPSQPGGSQSSTPAGPVRHLHIEVPTWCGKYAVGMNDYNDGVVGAKSKNLGKLRGKLPDWIKMPGSATLPFGSFEQVLELPENSDMKKQLSAVVQKIQAMATGHTDEATVLLAQCRELAMKVVVPRNVRDQLAAEMKSAGIPVPESEGRWELALAALRGVWASKFNDRAYYSLRKIGISPADIRMAVLVQAVVPAQYAFVIHTRNPSTNDENEIFCELVLGLGESLVSGMVPGSSLAFKARKNNLEEPEVLCYPSKGEGMFVRDSLIFRSDSNGEDLEGYAGAGLFESITMDPTLTKKVDYMDDKLIRDANYRRELLARICKVGAAIEKSMGSAQDIEGVVAPDGSITVVQTRPQV